MSFRKLEIGSLYLFDEARFGYSGMIFHKVRAFLSESLSGTLPFTSPMGWKKVVLSGQPSVIFQIILLVNFLLIRCDVLSTKRPKSGKFALLQIQ